MSDENIQNYDGYAIYSTNNKPLGVISSDGERRVKYNSHRISSKLKQYLISIEDQRYYTHGAIDLKGITRAIFENLKAGRIVQGGSTITQQLARNILRDNRKSLVRKFKETKLAFEFESCYSKDEILGLYLNNVFWGRRNYGLRAASLEYFYKEPEHLNISEQIALLTFLRGPNYYLKNPHDFKKRNCFIIQSLAKKKLLKPNKIAKIGNCNVQIGRTDLEIFPNNSVPFISKIIDDKKFSVRTWLKCELQKEVKKYTNNSNYPVSVLCLSKGKVIAVGSTHGSDYPFIYKSNVGSTLKPFIYSFLRQSGVSPETLFETRNKIEYNWNVNEVQPVDDEFLLLKDALLLSNNNVFVNACYEVGIDKALSYLSNIIDAGENNLYPSSILGATKAGLSLYQLLHAYYQFFLLGCNQEIKIECLGILKEIAKQKFNNELEGAFLKTGTTNFNKERFAIVGYSDLLFGFLRQGNEVDDYSKEGGFISGILNFLNGIKNKIYKWN